MLFRRHSHNYNFVADASTGMTFRWGKTPEDDPSAAPWPELADVSISNHCTKGCEYCYRNSSRNQKFMSLDDYRFLLSELSHKRWGNVFQVALGGGEPLEHPDFFEIVDTTLRFGVVPNFTTNGKYIMPDVAQRLAGKVGAVAVSVSDFQECNYQAIRHLINAGIRTNIQFLLRRPSLQDATEFIEGRYDDVLAELNAVIFLTYKATGRASPHDCLRWGEELRAFVRAIDEKRSTVRIGFDACFVPLLLHSTKIDTRLVDVCESGFFSVYVDEDLNVRPCSFATQPEHCFSLHEMSFEKIWTTAFGKYRQSVSNECRRRCIIKPVCRGGCVYFPEINFCFSRYRSGALP